MGRSLHIRFELDGMGKMELNSIAINIEKLTFGYSKSVLFHNLSFAVQEGESIAVIGPNGAGKTTLLKLLLGLLKPWSGQITILGKKMTQGLGGVHARKNIAYVPQERVIGKLPISVYDAVLLGRYAVSFRGVRKPTKKDRYKVMEALLEVGLDEFISRDVATLSGGQLQRMAIARGLVREAPIILLDEPIAHLDKVAKEEIPTLLKKIQAERKLTMVTITHENIDMEYDRVLLLQGGKLKVI